MLAASRSHAGASRHVDVAVFPPRLARCVQTQRDGPADTLKTGGEQPSLVRPIATKRYESCATLRPVGSGAAIIVNGMKAVMPTAMARTTANTICQVSEGMVSRTMPSVA